MRQIRIRIAVLGLAAACWGIMFPEYTFTADSYAVICEDGEDTAYSRICTDENEKNAPCEPGDGRTDGIGTPQDMIKAAKEGKVSYRFKVFDFLKKNFWRTAIGK